ncbi:phosphatase PAP2 family protein [Cytobacillus sp. Hm23]
MIKGTELLLIDKVISDIFIVEHQSLIFKMFEFIAWFGSTTGIVTLVVVMIIFLSLKYRDFKGIILLVIMVFFSNVLNKMLKEFFQRERPDIHPAIQEGGFSFPSGGALIGLVAYGLATYLIVHKRTVLKEKIIIGFCGGVLIMLIGISRIALGAHFPTDVIAGHMLGLILLILAIYLCNYIPNTFLKK